MSPGGTLYQIHSRFGRGLHVAYARDIVRPRILSTPPCIATDNPAAEIHVMTSADDWLNLIWTLKSFYRYSRRRYRLCIHEDGSPPSEAIDQLRRHFPAARIISRHEADERMRKELVSFPRCLDFRITNRLSPKVFDFATFLQGDRLLLFDSDLLFFRNPEAMVSHVEDPEYRRNIFNADCGFGYTVTPDVVREHLGFELLPEINSGLGLIHRASMRWDWVEEFLGLPEVTRGHPWRIEQTLIALCGSRFGAALLPDDYTVYLGREPLGNRPMRHYVGRIRHLMYVEGMIRLARRGILDSRR